jgi:mono/diheme cytochrome c family protein
MTLRPFLRKLIMVLPFLVPLFFSGCSAPPGNPEEGKRWYMMHNCYSCHGLHGDDGRAAKIAGIKMSFGSFVRKLRSTDSSIMRPFPESKISQQDAADIYAYLKQMPPKDAR